MGGIIAASGNVFLSHTGAGRKLTQVVAKEVFDDALGFPPGLAYMASSVTLNAAVQWGLYKGYDYLAQTPTGTVDWDHPIDKTNIYDTKYSEFHENMGKSFDTGYNVVETVEKGGTAYPILDGEGNLIGIYAQKGAYSLASLPDVGINHTAVVLKGADGAFYNSMSGWRGYNAFGITSLCHQMSNQAFLKAGLAMTVNGVSSGWFSYVTGAIYGPYGSVAPALSYYEWESNH